MNYTLRMFTVPKPKGPEKWQLYNLAKDPGEIHDLADQEPERMEKMTKLWDQYVLETGVVPLAPELGNVSHDWIEIISPSLLLDLVLDLSC